MGKSASSAPLLSAALGACGEQDRAMDRICSSGANHQPRKGSQRHHRFSVSWNASKLLGSPSVPLQCLFCDGTAETAARSSGRRSPNGALEALSKGLRAEDVKKSLPSQRHRLPWRQ
jgi:hypothetical protein